MRRIGLILAVFTLFLSCSIQSAYPFWIWTPESSRWANPKASVKPNPKEQLKFIQELYQQAKYKETIEECRKLIKYYPKAFEAPDAQFYIGLSLEADNKKLYEAYLAYQKVIDKYPFSGRMDQIIEKELKIAQVFMSGEKRKAMGVELPVENPAIEIFRKVVDNSAYGKQAAYAQYLLGMTLKDSSRFQEAREEFDKVGTTYPESQWASQARFQSADCATRIAPKADYDQELTKKAREEFEEFVKSRPQENLAKDAGKQIDSLKEKEAAGNLKIADFYKKQKKYAAAKVYYQEIIEKCPYCASATPAREALKELETQ
ncbi:MAG: tetratricopeptide repeat protein [Candidatus Omnitrophota bacterium]|nr:tetratricopeptide repeat protein [Candidatus Omnitrophota bacterium]